MFKKALVSGLAGCLLFSGNLISAQQPEVKVSAAKSETAQETQEPADSYKLQIDGKEFEIFTDKVTELPIKSGNLANPENLKVTLKVEPLKTFTYGGIFVQYPRYFTFEADLNDDDVSLWNLSGNQCVLMIQRYPAEMDHQVMAKMLQPRFGEGNATLGECSMKLNGSITKGSKVVTAIGDSTISQDIFSFKVGEGSLLLIFQDTLGAKGEPSEEGNKFRELITRTLKLPPAG